MKVTVTNWTFNQYEYTVKAGEEVKISLVNKEGIHGLAIDDFDVNIKSEDDVIFAPEKPGGKYEIYCGIL